MPKDLTDHTHIETFKGWAMYLTPSFDFVALRDIAGEEKQMAAASKRELYEKIVARLNEDEKLERTTWHSFEAMDETGKDVVVKGIRKNDGRLLMSPWQEVSWVYPRTRWIKAALDEREGLYQQIKKLDILLRNVRIDAKPGYGNPSFEKMKETYEHTLKDFERASKAAQDRTAELAVQEIEAEKKSA